MIVQALESIMSSPDEQQRVGAWRVCALLLLATTLNYMDRMTLNQMGSEIKLTFGLNNTDYGFVESGFAFSFALGALIAGYIVDKVNVRWVYAIAVLGWSAAGFATGFANGFGMLIVCRCALGFFEAGNWPCGIQTVRRVLPPEKRSLGNGLFHSGTALGAIITPFIVLGCLLYFDPERSWRQPLHLAVGALGASETPAPPYVWQWPFRIVGVIGLVWIFFWLVLLKPAQLAPSTQVKQSTEPFSQVLKNRRFWLMVLMILAVNTPWHSFRVWMPLYLREERGYSAESMNLFSSLYYLFADVGSIFMGFLTLRLVRKGFAIHKARMTVFGICVGLLWLTIVAANVQKGPVLLGCLLLVGFAALGLFPTYFALSQEISAKHQGKVTGTLGCINAVYLGFLFPSQGKITDIFGSYSYALAISGLLPTVAFVCVWAFWNRREEPLEREDYREMRGDE